MQPCVILTFNGIWEVVFEEFVALEEVADDGDLCLYNFVESFWAIFKYLCSGFHG